MKTTLFALFFLITIKTFACDCDERKFITKFTSSDLVASVKIIKVYKNKNEEELYKADILINDLYKGKKLKSIYIEGRSDGKKGSSCAIFIPKNTELIIYASKNGEGKYTIGFCSGLLYLNTELAKYQEEKRMREIEMLNLLREKGFQSTDRIHYYPDNGDLSKQLLSFKGIQSNKKFAIYEITFTPDLAVKSVNQISGFDNELDDKLMTMIKNCRWNSSYDRVRNKVPDNSKYLIAFYFYESQNGHESFIGEYDI